MKLNVNFLRTNIESIFSMEVQHCSVSEKEEEYTSG